VRTILASYSSGLREVKKAMYSFRGCLNALTHLRNLWTLVSIALIVYILNIYFNLTGMAYDVCARECACVCVFK